ncbi:SDR family oxidoreductase [Qipengyuania sp. 6B39]|uniref:SDR family oxidoreductase n=1 Tax=Qipengyuania proteolytica TaxID=2867239 RepID=UPI001C8A8A03|nr:SDR family oxidoreductase [Qipengyuania proteolytica]MBX7494487.1 SDR family oxidoreductase [Qipengyuania proteolytica]
MTRGERFHGKVALVTGAARGMGREIARRLAAEGAIVWIGGREEAALAEAAAEMGGDVRPLAFDLADEAACIAALDRIAAETGLDILVNNAGDRDRRSFDQLERADMERLLRINLVAPFDLARRSVPLMRARGYGRIVNVTSIASEIARGDASYTASKAGLDGVTRSLAAELGPYGITVNAVAPGFVLTEANEEWFTDTPDIAEHLARRTSLGRWAEPREIAGAVAFLASDDGSYVTGHTLIVDGGYVTHF